MRTIIISIVCVCFTLISLNAQNGRRDKIKALKVAHITEQLQLSSDEAQKFWPIYNAYEENTQRYRAEKLGKIKTELKTRDLDNISEAEAKQMLDQINKVEENLYLERKQLIENLQKVISAKKILLLKKAEDDFNKQLLYRLKEQRQKRFNRN